MEPLLTFAIVANVFRGQEVQLMKGGIRGWIVDRSSKPWRTMFYFIWHIPEEEFSFTVTMLPDTSKFYFVAFELILRYFYVALVVLQMLEQSTCISSFIVMLYSSNQLFFHENCVTQEKKFFHKHTFNGITISIIFGLIRSHLLIPSNIQTLFTRYIDQGWLSLGIVMWIIEHPWEDEVSQRKFIDYLKENEIVSK